MLPFLTFSQEKVKTSDFFDDLTVEERRIIVLKGTEKPYSGVYNKHFRKSGWSLSIGQKTVDLNNLVAQKKIFVASGQKLEVVEPFTGASVLKYIRAVDKVTGSVRAFRPKRLPNGSTVPKVLFLDKASPNSMNLNPYAKLILTSDFSGDEWFKTFLLR